MLNYLNIFLIMLVTLFVTFVFNFSISNKRVEFVLKFFSVFIAIVLAIIILVIFNEKIYLIKKKIKNL